MKMEEKTEGSSVRGPGRLLRDEREKKGYTYQDISEKTRLRPGIIKAVEDEDWDSLPSPAFVRGFLRNYARVLSLDEKPILEAYGREISLDGGLLRITVEPLRRRKKGPFFLLCILAAAAVFALWKAYAPRELDLIQQRETSPPVIAEAKKMEPADQVVPESVHQKAGEIEGSGPVEVEAGERQEMPAEDVAAPTEETPVKRNQHSLIGKVRSRTWVKIYVDDLNPREYMLQPGQQPEWKASRGFYLIIGNAGGIDFEWNGRAVPAAGKAGQVVKIRIPEDFRHGVEGN